MGLTPAQRQRTDKEENARTNLLWQVLRSPFSYVLLPSLLFYTAIPSRNWIPIHDAFQVTNVAYFLLNEAATHPALPLWYPYINYGVDTNWYILTTLGPSLTTM